jgi:hypothetical protein
MSTENYWKKKNKGNIMSEELKLPKGIRFITEADIMEHPNKDEMLRAVENTVLVQGYDLRRTTDKAFREFFMINVNAGNLFDFFKKLTFAIIPDVAAPIISDKDDRNTKIGHYTNRDTIIAMFEQFKEQLVHDPFLQFGILFQFKVTEEIFVKAGKYIQVWTNQGEKVRSVLTEFGIEQKKGIRFIDELPRVDTTMYEIDPEKYPHFDELLENIKSKIDKLPKLKSE